MIDRKRGDIAVGEVRAFLSDDYVDLWGCSWSGRPSGRISREEARKIAALLIEWANELANEEQEDADGPGSGA